MKIPESVNNLITRLELAGFEAYAVGGCVRDSLMGQQPKDWDVCTSAMPFQVQKVFCDHRVLETGVKHGTVTVLWSDMSIEVTTFRLDGEYEDNRRPKSVEFTKDIAADLARRDFTLNAMAFAPKSGLKDPFKGMEDIRRGLIRAVGDPHRRFREDALRIMRGVRFGAALGFEIEEKTAEAMIEERALLGNISAERIRDELLKALMGGKILPVFKRFADIIVQILPEMRPCLDCAQETKHHCFDVYTHILTAVDSYGGSEAVVKLALLLHDIGKPHRKKHYNGSDHFKGHSVESVRIADGVLRRLRVDNASAKKVLTLIRFHDVRLVGGDGQLLKLTRLVGKELMPSLFDVMEADISAQSAYMRAEKLLAVKNGRERYRSLMNEGRCCSLKELAIDGSALKNLKGRKVGAALYGCLNAVMDGRIENEPAALECFARKLSQRWQEAEARLGR